MSEKHLAVHLSFVLERLADANRRADRMEAALRSISTSSSSGNRNLDELMLDMGYINDAAREALNPPEGAIMSDQHAPIPRDLKDLWEDLKTDESDGKCFWTDISPESGLCAYRAHRRS